MLTSLNQRQLQLYVTKQLEYFYPDGDTCSEALLGKIIDLALQRLELSFTKIKLPGFRQEGVPYFNHLNTDHYAMLLYLLSNTYWKETKDPLIATKLMYLNKSLHSFNCMYDTELPDIFCFIHLLGTVLGKAKYDNYLAVYQGVTVGSHGGKSPQIGKYVSLLPHSQIIGGCHIEDKVSVGVRVTLYNEHIKTQHIVIEADHMKVMKPSNKLYSEKIFHV